MTTSDSADARLEELQQLRFRVHGRVQGVGFRWWTRSQARRLRLTGDVRNRPDGTVEIRARGRRSDLESFAAVLKDGAPGADVSKIDQEPAEDVPSAGFEIAH